MKLKYFDKAIEILFLGLFFLLPIIFDRRIGIVFSGTKSAFLRGALIVILVIWLYKLLLGGKYNFKRTILDWPILSFLLIVSAATLASVNSLISFWGFYGRYEGLITWFCYGLLFFIVSNYFAGLNKVKLLIASIVPTSAIMSIYGIIQRQNLDPYAWGGVVTWQRVISTIGQPNFLAAYILMAFFLMMFLFLEIPGKQEKIDDKSKKNKKPVISSIKWEKQLLPVLWLTLAPIIFIASIYSQNGMNVFLWYFGFLAMAAFAVLFAYQCSNIPKMIFDIVLLASLGLNYICFFYTQSRGAYLGFIVGLALFFLLVPKNVIFLQWKKLSALFILILLITGVTILNPGYSPFQRFSEEIKIGDESASGKKTIEQNGKGIELKAKKNVELKGAAGSRGETWKSAFRIISDNPVFGIGPEALKMVFPRYETELFRFKEDFHVKQDRCHNETFDVPVTKGLLGLFTYLIIIYLVFKTGLIKWKNADPNKKALIAAILAAASTYLIQNQFSFGVIAITSLFWIIWGMILACDGSEIEEEKKSFSIEDIPWLPVAIILISAIFIIFMMFLQFRADLYFKTAKSLSEIGNLSEALPNYEKAVKIFPYEGGTITHYGITLINLSQRMQGEEKEKTVKKAIDIFAYGMKVDPFNADNFYITSRIYLIKGNLLQSVEFANKALKIDPYYAEAHLTLANVKEKMGQMAEAQAHYEKANQINPNLMEGKIKMGWKLINANKLDEAFKLFQELMVAEPKNPDIHNALGTIYLKRGDKIRAKEEFEWLK
ncbi:MAG: hypothetical protein FD145_133 [Candidatus Saganbacteria bacterium]|uniref:O-antigen ligase-related domain-containing protein n=1 Tax=Candidatus Saganbacteria bacterium TaxID=2575572 RepID=A0A833L2M0_UNCSA|nr:MAG: hypothetical protein FD145_133 [Candidatus Saganbacteria bacterium]